MKKVISLMLALLCVCALLVSCNDDGTPEGMKSVTRAGEPFILYVPDGFTDNTAGGISSAYYTQVESSLMVSARYYTPSDKEMTLEGYMAYCLENYAASLDGFEKTEDITGDILGGADARRISYKMNAEDTGYTVSQITAKHGECFVSLSLYATGEGMDAYSDFITQIRDNFTLVEKSAEPSDEYIDKNTPAGMKIASTDDMQYRFYVPKTWVCSSASGVSEAYYPESERTNATLTVYSPTGSEKGIALDEYYNTCIEDYEKTLGEFTLVGESKKLTVAEKDALSFEYTVKYDGTVYKIRQVMLYASQHGLFYTFTYTAVEQNYELHMADFEQMLSAFVFR